MKLTEITKNKGTYAGVRFTEKTLTDIKDYMDTNEIPNPLPNSKMHSTLLYSRKYLPDYKPAGKYKEPLKGESVKFEKWPSQPDGEGKVSMCLVLLYDCPDLNARHEELMKEHDAEYDFDDYKTHITFSYDVGGFRCKKLPDVDFDIEVMNEYMEDLNLDWAKGSTKD